MTFASAVKEAQRLAREGPRCAAVLESKKSAKPKFHAVPGFMDADTEVIKQVVLVTPDGRVWASDSGAGGKRK